MLSNFETLNWDDVRTEWITSIGNYDNIGCRPDPTLDDFLTSVASQMVDDHVMLAAAVREIVFREALFLVHKSCAVMLSLQRDLQSNKQTYAEVSGYIASFFAAKAMLMILGFSFCEKPINNRSLSIFLFKKNRSGNFYVEAFTRNKTSGSKPPVSSVSHKKMWETFKSIFSKYSNLPIDLEFLAFLPGILVEDFSLNRHSIQYRNCEWGQDDLHCQEFVTVDWLQDFDKTIYGKYSGADSNFSIVLTLVLLRSFYQLFESFHDGRDCLTGELDRIKDNIGALHFLRGTSWIV
jgi:hypothetical protein